MSKILDVTRDSVRGVFYLSVGHALSTFVNAFTIIIMARLLGPESYGLYIVLNIVPALLISFCDIGISPALTKYTAQLFSQGEKRKAVKNIKTGIIAKTFLSLGVSILVVLFSDWIGINVLYRSGIGYLVALTSLYLFGQAVLNTLRSVFMGLDSAEKSSLLMNINAIVKSVVSLALVFLGFGVSGALIGLGVGVLISSIIGFALLFKLTSPIVNSSILEYSTDNDFNFKRIIVYGLPIYFSVLIGVFQRQIQSIILSLFDTNINIGNYATAMNFTIFLGILSTPIVTTLFPAFSKLDVNTEREMVGRAFRLAVKYTALVMIPTSFALSLLSEYAVSLLYGREYLLAPGYLSLYSILYLGTGFGMFVSAALLNSQGNTKATLVMNVLKCCISIPLAWVLIPKFGVYGIITSLITSEFASTALGLLILRQAYDMNVDIISTIRIILASSLSYVVVAIFQRYIHFSTTVVTLFCGTFIFFGSFFLFAPIFSAITNEDIDNFVSFSDDLPIGKSIIRVFANFERRVYNLFSFNTSRQGKKVVI